jgi:spore germination cell wall hydrolase CwlJ-like protein
MNRKKNDSLARSDRALVAAMAIIIATASAALGASISYRPSTDKPVAVTVAATPSPVAATDSPQSRLIAEHRCLTDVMYYEARGEGASGQKAIAEVVFSRMRNGNYGQSICAVVYEGAKRSVCQFSFACSGDMDRPKDILAWREAEHLAALILTGEVRLRNATGGATNFHATSVEPDWAATLQRTTQIGNHVFYRGGPGRSRDS